MTGTVQHILVADVGGTNGRFALVQQNPDGAHTILDRVRYDCAHFNSLEEMATRAVRHFNHPGLENASFALAASISDGTAQFTNLPWHTATDTLTGKIGLKSVFLLNDFEAVAHAVPLLAEGHMVPLKNGEHIASAPISIIGPGTGFGVAHLVPIDHGYKVISTEGGHMAFAPGTPLEIDLWKHLKEHHDHVSIETILSGQGLVRIHDFLIHRTGDGPKGLSPQEVTGAAAAGDIPSCYRAVQLFLSVLGSVAGDLALAQGARGGVWFAGGILPKIIDMITESDMVTRFQAKGVMASYVEQIPINLITSDDTAFVGAAAAQKQRVGS